MTKQSFTDLFMDTFRVFREHWKLFVTMAFLLSFLPAILLTLGYVAIYGTLDPEQFTSYDIIVAIVTTFLSLLLTLSILEALRAKKGKKTLALGKAFHAGRKQFWSGFLLMLLSSILLVFLFILLIIPGIIYSVYWAFSYYALVFEKKSVWESLKYSRKVVKGTWWRVFGYVLLLTLIIVIVSLIIIFPFGVVSVIFTLTAPTVGMASLVVLYVIMAALDALTLLFMLIFLERFYIALKKEKKL